MKKITAIFSAVVLLLSSCHKDDVTLKLSQGEPFTTQINLTVEDMSAGTDEVSESYSAQQIQTRSSLAEEPSTDVKNLWVIQFGSDGNVVGMPKYIANFGVGEGLTNEVSLIPSGTVDNTIVYLANTFRDNLLAELLVEGLTLESLGSLGYTSDDEAGCFTSDGTTKYMVMSGTVTCPISPDTWVSSCTLKRNVAKITINIENNIGLTFSSISLKGVSDKLLYYTNRTTALPDKLPEYGTFSTTSYSVEDVTNLSDITIYVPMNMRGVVSNESELHKNHYATPRCTALQLIAYTQDDKPLAYTFYLGGNLTNDFNLKANTHYHYTLNFTDEGDSNTDMRIEELGGADFTTSQFARSNCYILNPSVIDDAVFYIPIDRIDEFWSDEVYVEDEYKRTHNVLASVGNNWEVVMLWHDSQTLTYDETAHTLGGLKLEKATSPAGKSAVKVTLPSSFANRDNHCNVAYVVRRADGDKDILWSWHLWITDYNPYIDYIQPFNFIYQYKVKGGELHRYDNDIFNSGIYSNKLIMDRNLGARSADFEGHGSITNDTPTNPGTLYYQFGRKDPFPRITINKYLNGYTYGTDGSNTTKQNFEYVVNNPSKFVISFGNWCSIASSQTTTNIWNDYKIEVAGYSSGKSIFDPSPLGFRLPLKESLNGFTGSYRANEQANPNNYTFHWTLYCNPIPDNYKNGRLYEGFAYIPTSGCLYCTIGGLIYGGSTGYLWSATSCTSNYGYHLTFDMSYVYLSHYGARAYGYPVRPIQE